MDGQSVKRVVVAGGGTAGWIAAATLAKLLGPLLDIVLVESEEIGTVGVGEATIPTHRTYHHLMGIDEREFMRATRATFKLGIAFENWALEGDRYIHSFGTLGKSTWMADFHHIWLEARRRGLAGEIGEYCFELQAAEAGRFATSEKARINYAYHLDASLYAGFLRGIAEAHGVQRIEGKIATVEQDGGSGFIDALVLESGARVEGDLFIDCTGFRGLLIEQALETGYEDWSHWLPTNAAWAVQTRSAGGGIPPYTKSIAGAAGWQWRIPLQHRVGNGIVFCSDYMEPEAARETLLGAVAGETLTEPRLIRYRTGRRRQVWNRNCLALGLASGFVEPLESTSIHLIQTASIRLVQNFPFAGIHDALVQRFNDQSRTELERIRDFIVLHYRLNRRDEPFWRRCATAEIPDSLARRIALFEQNGVAYQGPEDLFRVDSWLQVMLGQRLEPRGHHLLGQLMSEEQMSRALAGLRGNIARAVERMPAHADFLRQYGVLDPQQAS